VRVVVTGSEGYIGTNLCKLLRSFNFDVLGLDKVNDGGDIVWDGIEDRIRSFKPDWIVHLAALPAILACEENKEQATIDNVKTTEIISDIASELNCPVMFSSSQAAKNPKSSHYAWCKNESEEILNTINSGYIMRFSNIYGGCKYLEKKSSVMALFAKAYLLDKLLVVNGDGKQGRDFLHVDDLIKIISDLMNITPTKMYTIDIGTGIATSILDVVKMFGDNYIYNPDSSSVGLESNFADTTMMKRLVDYVPVPRMKEWIEEIK
jgi:nucleoside-diphosphate-sugar epimerase